MELEWICEGRGIFSEEGIQLLEGGSIVVDDRKYRA